MSKPNGNMLQLVLATGAFALCFAVFGSVSALMPLFRKMLHLTPVQVSIAIAGPVWLGSLGRIPLGMLEQRFGGRRVFTAVMVLSIIPAVLMGWVHTYVQLVVCGLFLGISLASFAVGIGFVNRWYPPEKQGTALGIYGAGNIGQSLAAFGSPVLALWAGMRWGFWTFAVLLTMWLALFLVLARNAPGSAAPTTLRQLARPLRERGSWVLSLYYFLTFGGFVAMAIYLPTFLTELFKLTPQDAGFRTAGFVVLATGMRPIGGWLADRVGGRTVLGWVFPATIVMAIFLSIAVDTRTQVPGLLPIIPFTVGALGMAAAIGLGNGAVFKLVPEYFPKSVGPVTGLVGAAGGLGGFFPPLVLGAVRQYTGQFTLGFVLLATFAAICLLVLRRTSARRLAPALVA
jgi:NNP family nitrate/nitrite transporter-like MFS transporter